MNARLRLAIQNARAENMPKDNIERAIKKAIGGDAENYEEVRYEGYGPGGVALIVEALTDNRNRTAGAVRSYFTKNGGALGETGSVAFMFDRVGQIVYPASGRQRRRGARSGDRGRRRRRARATTTATSSPAPSPTSARSPSASKRRSARPRRSRPSGSRRPRPAVDEDKAATLMKLIGAIEDDDDVQDVYANFEVPDEVMEKLTAA